ncbi:MAG TPA: hypothetical protein VNT79_07720, partial [Phycisphaerae bacterium]|nr:hypothetical protein [Phycisphaerae bacterium]
MHQKFLLSAISLVGLLVCNPAFARSACVQPAELATANGQGEPEENEKKSSAASKPQVEVFVPSIERLSAAARRSRTAQIYRGLSAMLPSLENETGEGLNVEAVVKLLSRVRSWDDTSLAIAIFTQDREGRPRWLIRVDWPVTKLVERVREVLADEAGKEIFKNIELKEGDDGVYRLELPEMELAVLKSHADGSMIASAASVAMPAKIFGLETKSPRNDSAKKKSFLAYCSLNLDAGEEEQKGSSFFSGIAGISAVRYVVSLNKDAEWVEQFAVSWNPLLGAAIKLAVQKARHPFDCPNDAYAVAVLNLGLGEGMADALTGLPIGTIGDRAGSEMLFAAVPGTGFLPIPDTFYVLRAQGRTEIIQSIRKAIRKETSRRAEDDLPPRWREMNIDGKTVFWRDPAADGSYGLIPMTFRTVIFFDGPGSNDEDEDS